MKKISLFLMIVISLLLSSCSAFVNDLSKLTTNADYTVKHFFEVADSEDEWDETLTEIETLSGPVGKLTSAVALNRSGFYLKEDIAQQKIKADGSTIVEVYYKRTLSDVEYTVKYHFEAVDSEDYDYFLTETQTFTGQLRAQTNVTAPDYEGFYLAKPVVQQRIISDGSTVVDVYYKRKIVTVTFNLNGGVLDLSNDNIVMEGKYGIPIERPHNPTKILNDPYYIGYKFIGWMPGNNPADSTDTVFLPITFPAENKVYTAKWSLEKVPYTVVEKRQNADGTYLVTTTTKGGTVGELTDVTVEEIPGYTTPVVVNKVITVDDSDPENPIFTTEVTVTYERKEITITLDIGEGYWPSAAPVLKGLYGSAVPEIGNPERAEGWGFAGWNVEGGSLPLTYPTEDVTYTAKWVKPYSKYTVEHWLEKVTSSDATNFETNYEPVVEIEDDEMIGSVGAVTHAQPKSITGFAVTKIEEKVLPETDDTVVRVFYARKTVTITANPGGGKWNSSNEAGKAIVVTGKYGTPVTGLVEAGNPTKQYWEFLGWNEAGKALPTVFPEENKVYIAVWNQTGALYSVKYLFEKLDSTNENDFANSYEEITEYARETFAGDLGALTDVTPKTAKTGFEVKSIANVTILADDSAVAAVYYKRKNCRISFDTNKGKWDDDNTSTIRYLDGKYGTSVAKPNYVVVRNDYDFAGWDPTPAEVLTFTEAQQVYSAKWNYRGTDYKVKYYFEKASYSTEAEKYELIETETITAKAEETTEVQPAAETGFIAEPVVQKTIAADGSTVVDVYYNRISVTYTFDFDNGSSVTRSGKFGTPVQNIPDYTTLTKSDSNYDYKCTGWDSEPDSTYGVVNKTYKAVWEKEKTLYAVKYFYENAAVSPSVYEENEAQRVVQKGTIGEEITITPAAVTGYVTPAPVAKEVAEDGSTVIEVKYERAKVTLTFKANGGNWTNDYVSEGKIGAAFDSTTVPAVTLANKVFVCWDVDGARVNLPTQYPSSNVTYTARWAESVRTYTVKHLFQTVDLTGYEENEALRSEESDVAGEYTEVTALNITGFTAAPVDNVMLPDNDSTVIEVKYNRNEITYTFNPGTDATWKTTDKSEVKGKYGTAVTAPVAADLSRSDYYSFTGWSPVVPSTFTADNKTFTAVWEKVKADYVVKYYEEQIDGSYTLVKTETKTGTVGSRIALTASDILPKADVVETPDGFQAPVISTIESLGSEDNSQTVEVKYARKLVTYTFSAGEGRWLAGTTSTFTEKYGAPVTIPDISYAVKDGSQFRAWSPAVPQYYGTENKTFTMLWNDSLSGVGENTTKKDLSLTYVTEGRKVTVTAALPYASSNWNLTWVLDSAVLSEKSTELSAVVTAKVTHTIMLIASESKTIYVDGAEKVVKNTFTKTISVKVE